MFGFGSFAGMVLGGGLGSYLYRFDKRYPVLLAGSMAILGCIPLWILLNFVRDSTPFFAIAVVSVISGLSASATGKDRMLLLLISSLSCVFASPSHFAMMTIPRSRLHVAGPIGECYLSATQLEIVRTRV